MLFRGLSFVTLNMKGQEEAQAKVKIRYFLKAYREKLSIRNKILQYSSKSN